MEVPSFLRQLVKETEKMVTFFFKGGRREQGVDDEYFENEEDVGRPYLDRPILEKDTAEGGSKWGINYGMASMQGWRAQMEDSHTCMPEMTNALPEWSYFAVYDGHAGRTVAQYCSRHLLDFILHTGTHYTQIISHYHSFEDKMMEFVHAKLVMLCFYMSAISKC